MGNERFKNNNYYVNFDVNFNKKNILYFMEKKNIFPSIPKKQNLLLIPVLVDLQEDKILLFNNNILLLFCTRFIATVPYMNEHYVYLFWLNATK